MWNICMIMYMATAYMFIYKSTKRAFYFKGGKVLIILGKNKDHVYDEERTRATMYENDFYS